MRHFRIWPRTIDRIHCSVSEIGLAEFDPAKMLATLENVYHEN